MIVCPSVRWSVSDAFASNTRKCVISASEMEGMSRGERRSRGEGSGVTRGAGKGVTRERDVSDVWRDLTYSKLFLYLGEGFVVWQY